MRDGTHPCYIDKPKQFNKKFRAFLFRKLSKGRGKKFFLTHRDDGGFDNSHKARGMSSSGSSKEGPPPVNTAAKHPPLAAANHPPLGKA